MSKEKHSFPLPADFVAEGAARDLLDSERNPDLTKHLKGLTVQQQRYVILALQHPYATKTEIAKSAGYSPTTNIRQVERSIRGVLGDALHEFGITELDIARVIRQGLTATKITRIVVDGKVKEYVEPDMNLRLRCVDRLMRLGGYEAPKKADVRIGPTEEYAKFLRQTPEELERHLEADYEEVDGTDAGTKTKAG